jgi:prophage tail gpP-like protein
LFSPQVHSLEIPAWTSSHVQGRVETEHGWQQRDQVTVFVTVYGWLKPGGSLWERDEDYFVKSPMLIMDGSLPLTARSVTFMQNNQVGTRTTLELCNPQALQGLIPKGSPGSTSEG